MLIIKVILTHISKGKGNPRPKSFFFSSGCSKAQKMTMNTSGKMLHPISDIIFRLSFDNQFQLQKHPKNEQRLYAVIEETHEILSLQPKAK